MILLDSGQIVAAVRRSLAAHVLPAIGDDFARLQVTAALQALAEVHDRLTAGDPMARVNTRFEADLLDLARELAETDPATADRVEALLSTLAEADPPRTRARELGRGLTGVLGDAAGASRRRLLDLLQDHAARTAGEDTIWMCREAIESLQ